MIRASFSHREGRFRVCVQGHAGFAPAGRDIVCAGASALSLTLAACLQKEEMRGTLRLLSIRQEPGWLEIQAAPTLSGLARFSALLEGAEEGFRLLAQQYPTNVVLESELWSAPNS